MSNTNWVLFLRIFIIPLPKSYTPTRAYFNKFDLNVCFDFVAIIVVCVCFGSTFLLSYLLNLPQGILIGLINRGIP